MAAVLAESRYQAEDAVAGITIDFEPLPPIIDPEQAANPGAPLLHEEAGTNVLLRREFKRGEVDAVMEQAARAGAQVVKAAGDTFWGGYAGYFQDPDGHLWEIVWNPQMVIAD